MTTKPVLRRSALPVLVAFIVGSLFCTARAEEKTPRCSEEIYNVGSEMIRSYGVKMAWVKTRPITDQENPYPGSMSQFFAMDARYHGLPEEKKAGVMASNFFNSRGVQLRLAKRVMEACPSISIVEFGFAWSDDSIPYYRMSSGLIQPGVSFACGRDVAPEGPTPWGYYYGC